MLHLLAANAVSSAIEIAPAADDADGGLLLLALFALVLFGGAALVVRLLWPGEPISRRSPPSSRKLPNAVCAPRESRAAPPKREAAPPAQRRSREEPAPPAERPDRDAPVPSSRRPRFIQLFAVTPGQRPSEYNVGDSEGSRGSPAE
jgi:hypothetical protein